MEFEPTGKHGCSITGRLEVAEAAMKPMPAPLKKHLPHGCTIDMPPSNCCQWEHVSPCDTMFFYELELQVVKIVNSLVIKIVVNLKINKISVVD